MLWMLIDIEKIIGEKEVEIEIENDRGNDNDKNRENNELMYAGKVYFKIKLTDCKVSIPTTKCISEKKFDYFSNFSHKHVNKHTLTLYNQ